MIKCEAYDQITINSGATSPIFFQSTNTFVNLLTLIQSSSSFQENIPRFGRYKIVGMNIRASLGSAISTLDAAFLNCAPTLSLAFYPQLAGTALGVNPAYNDQKLLLDPSLAVPQTKYWKFHDNYFVCYLTAVRDSVGQGVLVRALQGLSSLVKTCSCVKSPYLFS